MLFIKDCSCCPAFIKWCLENHHVKQWPNQSSYTSNHLIAKRDEYPCHAKQWPTPTSPGVCAPITSQSPWSPPGVHI